MIEFCFRFLHEGNKYDVHGLVSWDRTQKVGFDFFGDYSSFDKDFWCRYSLSVDSTAEPIPKVNMTIYHKQYATNVDTNIYIMVRTVFF